MKRKILLTAILASMLFLETPRRLRLGAAQLAGSTSDHPISATGGHLEFEVASLKQNVSGSNGVSENFNMDSSDSFADTGGLLRATNRPVRMYIDFAYKLSNIEVEQLTSQLPKWAKANRYDLTARAGGTPTRDQARLMMQSLLASRFKLALHFEARKVPVFALTMDKSGRLGRYMRSHLDNPPCGAANSPAKYPYQALPGGFPEVCGAVVPLKPTIFKTSVSLPEFGARNVTVAQFADSLLPAMTGLDRPLVDETGLIGRFDMLLEWLPPWPLGQTPPPDAQDVPPFPEALKDELGLNLKSTVAPVETVVLDHIEELSPN